MITIARFESLAACAHLREQMDALNRRARRPCPYSTFEYYENFLANDELLVEGRDARLLMLAVLDDGRLIGYAALRRRRTFQVGRRPAKIEWLVTRDTDRPHLVCAPDDEERCARAIVDHLVRREPRWTYLELGDQEDGDALPRAARALASRRLLVRTYPGHAHVWLDLRWAKGAAYFRSLSKKKRETASHDVRRLMTTGRVELLTSADAPAARALLPVYLAVERQSWKHRTGVGIGRHPKRVAFYEGLFDARQPMRAAISLLTLDGTPVAAMVGGVFGDSLYLIEVAYDGARERLSPGQALYLFTMLDAIDTGYAQVNLRNDSTHWKSQWLAESSPTAHVRVIRRPSLAWLASLAGAARRRLRARGRFVSNPLSRFAHSRREPAAVAGSTGPTPADALEAALASGIRVIRASHEELQGRLPFGAARAPVAAHR